MVVFARIARRAGSSTLVLLAGVGGAGDRAGFAVARVGRGAVFRTHGAARDSDADCRAAAGISAAHRAASARSAEGLEALGGPVGEVAGSAGRAFLRMVDSRGRPV